MQRLKFPTGSVECKMGDYLIAEAGARQWKIYKVEDLVLFSRLVPLRFPTGVELMEEKHIMDSENPAYADEIFLLLTVYEQQFGSVDEAKSTIRGGSPSGAWTGYYANIKRFPQTSTQVVGGAGP